MPAKPTNGRALEQDHAARGVDTIIRFHDVRALPELDRALFSLLHQTYARVRPVIVSQGLSDAEIGQMKNLVTGYAWSAKGLDPLIINVPNPAGEDIRSRLLNAGIAAATGRYLSILDADDYLYASSLDWLVRSLGDGEYDIAFGDIVVKHVSMVAQIPYAYARRAGLYKGDGLHDLLVENFCPIHSFVVDRRFIDPLDLQFCEQISRLEDYEFILRICGKYRPNFTSRSKAVGVYNWKADGSNSTVIGTDTLEDIARKQQPWDEARRWIKETRKAVQRSLYYR